MKKYFLSFCLTLLALSAWSQTRTITGQITGSTQDTLIGVMIMEKGTANGTSSDIDGTFSLTVKDTSNVVLVVSFLGYKEKEIAVGNLSQIIITMEEDNELEEIVVVGYGTVKKSDLTGSVVSLKPNDVKQVPSGNVMDAIQGKAAGVDIVRTSGESDKAPKVTVRGTRSISAGNDPLYIVDGVQYSSIQDINPNDIQSMEVLKDASSTAIYGSRGANGVIIITTKKGAAGGLKVFVNSYAGVSSVLAYPKAMNGNEWADLRLEAYKTVNPLDATPTYEEALGAEDFKNYQNGVQTDYTKEVLHNGSQKNLQFGVAGGNEKQKTYFSLDYFNEKGLLKNDNLNRYTGRLNIDYQLTKAFSVGAQTQITYYDQDKRANPLGNASKINPLTKPFADDGTIILIPGGRHANPLLDEQSNTAANSLKTLRLFPTVFAQVNILKNLTARTNLAMTLDSRSRGIFNAANSYSRINDGFTNSSASHEASNRSQINWQGIINYNTTFGKDHSIGITALSEIITNKNERFFAEANGQLIPEQMYFNLGENISRTTNSRYIKSALVSFAGRVNYSFKGKYLLTVTGREDGASVLAEGHKWDFFPSVAGAWKVTDEKFMESQNIFSTVKLRTSWGIAGNSNVDAYSTQSTLIRIPYSYDEAGVTAYTFRPQIGNKRTKWEKSTTWDFGLDLGILRERITMAIDYYDTRTRDLLLTKKLPLTTGVIQTVDNIGRTSNKGWEVSASSVNIRRNRFQWTTTITYMRNRERVVSLVDGVTNMQVTITDESTGSQNTSTVVVGSPVKSFYDYESIGIWQLGQETEAASFDNQKPGSIHIKDQDGDGKITPADRVVVGSTVPKWSGGFNSEFKYRDFDFTFYFFSRWGQTINYEYAYDASGLANSLSTRDYWTPENGGNDLPRPGLPIDQRYLKSFNYKDGSFVKLRNATLGYTLPQTFSKKFGVSRLRFYLTGKNLFVISKIKDYDPEMAGELTFPTVKLFIGGVNFEF